ncbi:MAG: hypothetical protein A2464_08380 [Deltaproteobacteria bacterium RIFOXYC2_FULL_48_10]|nr:MAG: hypothetical protein A2464_08380 [Deltaproteobacteria bacterium RIFOXYC2_FULL_48_10]
MAVFKTQTWTAKNKKFEQQKIKQFAAIGNNLNQLARWCNTYKTGVESIDVITSIISLQDEINQLRKEWDNCPADHDNEDAA